MVQGSGLRGGLRQAAADVVPHRRRRVRGGVRGALGERATRTFGADSTVRRHRIIGAGSADPLQPPPGAARRDDHRDGRGARHGAPRVEPVARSAGVSVRRPVRAARPDLQPRRGILRVSAAGVRVRSRARARGRRPVAGLRRRDLHPRRRGRDQRAESRRHDAAVSSAPVAARLRALRRDGGRRVARHIANPRLPVRHRSRRLVRGRPREVAVSVYDGRRARDRGDPRRRACLLAASVADSRRHRPLPRRDGRRRAVCRHRPARDRCAERAGTRAPIHRAKHRGDAARVRPRCGRGARAARRHRC